MLMKSCSRRAAVVSAVTLAVLAAPLTAWAEASSVHTDSVFPDLGNSGYRVDNYDLSFRYQPKDKEAPVHGDTVIAATASKRLKSLSLDAYGLDVKSVTVDGRKARFAAHDEKLTVSPRRPVESGAHMRIEVGYDVDPRAPRNVTGWADTTKGFAVAAQPDSAHTVFPCNDVPSDKAQFTFHVSVPDDTGYTAVASGLPVGKPVKKDGYTTYEYRTRNPMATELTQIAVGPYEVKQAGKVEGVPIRNVIPRGDNDKYKILALVPQQMKWAVKQLGPFPLEAYGVMPLATDSEKPFDFSGLETQTLTIYNPKYLREQPLKTAAPHMMHELVHSWFGGSVTPATWADNWLSEGSTNYYALQYRFANGWRTNDDKHDSMASAMKAVYENGDLYRRLYGPIAKPTKESLYSDQAYLGGPLALYALHEKVGAATFQRIEETFLKTYKDKSATTDDYIQVADRVAPHQGVKAFLDAWLKGTKTPPMPHHPDWKATSVSQEQAQKRESDLARNKEIEMLLVGEGAA